MEEKFKEIYYLSEMYRVGQITEVDFKTLLEKALANG